MPRVLLLYDAPGWAFHNECLAIARAFERFAPELRATVARIGSVADLNSFDIVYSSAYYHLNEAKHPKSVSQVSSYSYWVRKAWKGGWPHLREWRYMFSKNADLHAQLTSKDHPSIKLLYHPIDPLRFAPSDSQTRTGPFIVGYAGHRQAIKGLELIEWAIAGFDPEAVRLLSPTWEDGRIPAEKMPEFYKRLDAYICMSKPGEDAGPMSAIEAAFCGVPIITTRVGQIYEMVTDGETGLVIDRDVDSLRSAIARLREERGLHDQICNGLRAPEFRDRWGDRIAKGWTKAFQEIAND